MSAIRDEFDAIPDNELSETILERIEGLGEMFPPTLKNGVSSTIGWSVWGVKGLFSLTKSTIWVVTTTSLIAFLPFIIEKEISDLEKTQVAQQRQMLLGPSAAIQQAKSA